MKVAKTVKEIASLLVVAVVVIGLSRLLGIQCCTVSSGSMEPAIPTGSLCIISTRYDYDSIQEGDVVVYYNQREGVPVVHRVVAVLGEGLVTKGDVNLTDDGVLLQEPDLMGVYLWHVPSLGILFAAMRTPAGIAVTLLCVAVLMVLYLRDNRGKGKTDTGRKRRRGSVSDADLKGFFQWLEQSEEENQRNLKAMEDSELLGTLEEGDDGEGKPVNSELRRTRDGTYLLYVYEPQPDGSRLYECADVVTEEQAKAWLRDNFTPPPS